MAEGCSVRQENKKYGKAELRQTVVANEAMRRGKIVNRNIEEAERIELKGYQTDTKFESNTPHG